MSGEHYDGLDREDYTEWKHAVDRALLEVVGLKHDEMGDWGYRDGYESGLTPLDAAYAALEYNGYNEMVRR